MMSNKIGNKMPTTRSNRKTIRRVQTETDDPNPYRKTQLSNKGSQRNYSRQKQVAPYSKINIKDIPSHTRKTFKINTYKQYQNKLLKTQPDQLPRKITIQSQQKSQNIQSKYKIDGVAGKGTFGTVYFGHIRGSGEKIAVKKVLQDKRYKNRELQILKTIRNPSVLEMRDHFMTKQGDRQFLNVVMDFYPCNLYQTIKKKQLSHSLIKVYLYQILRGLNYLKTLSIAHRDIKPQNILVDSITNKAIICDLGSAKQLIQGEPNLAYICSRCYRATQLIFGANDYTTQIDMWSLGCVLVEMINGQPPFIGDSQIDQLFEIIKVLGTPTKEDIREMNSNYDMKEYSKIPAVKKIDWKQILKTQNSKLIDLVNKMLCYSPVKRITPAKAMLHPYFDELRNQDTFKQIQAKYKMIPNLFNLTIDELQMFDAQDTPIPKWSEKKYNPEALSKINSISVKRPVHRLV